MVNSDSVIESGHPPQSPSVADQRLLLFSIFIIAGCSLIYELLISSLSTYLLGSGVVHYSVTIGLFLFFMGVGAWLAQFVKQDLLGAFVRVEILLGLVGGLSALLLYAAYAWTQYYYPAMLIVIATISILVGMEIPLLTRVIEQDKGIRQGLSEVLATDYVGALLASLLFPFILLPYLGHLLTAFAIGAVNLLVALVVVWHFRHQLIKPKLHLLMSSSAVVGLLLISQFTTIFTGILERSLYQDPVIHTEQSTYQKVVVTERGRDLRLFLNGSLQFSSMDEYRYHEPLVHLPASHSRSLERALIIGGGDGLAARELLKYDTIKQIALVDLDPAVTNLGRDLDKLKVLNKNALANPKVTVHNTDAWRWLESDGDLFDVVIIDLPDPDTADIARLYTVEFYRKVARRLSVGGVMITQASSPWLQRNAFWCVASTLDTVFESVQAVYSQVPSFGPWGYVMTSDTAFSKQRAIPKDTRYVTDNDWQFTLDHPSDLPPLELPANQLQTLKLMQYYAEGYQALQDGE
ncbi:polyamine aminopropyltransferase [Leucothrix pacifica]|uniref:polyamine aminopropyltransferase n=1 Tax=Leucothrix pacifica TaxID=1247513 RepID=UPI0015E85C09|nr:polyamine aminopropyltransferase [Leucothrix pacifica]